MSDKEIEQYIQYWYPKYLEKLNQIQERLEEILYWYKENQASLFAKGDFRPGTFGRFLSNVISLRFHMQASYKYFSTSGWQENFNKNFKSASLPEGNFSHAKDIDTLLRFSLLHVVYSNLETTIRILFRALSLKEGKDPFNSVNAQVKIFTRDFLDFLILLRNTVHNNGYYYPRHKEPQTIELEYNGEKFIFEEGKTVEINTAQILTLVQDIIERFSDAFQNEPIVSLDVTPDNG